MDEGQRHEIHVVVMYCESAQAVLDEQFTRYVPAPRNKVCLKT